MQLTLNDLRKTYLLPAPLLHRRGQGKPKAKQALAGVSLTLGPGLYGLLGPNGAGKSTLIGIITGGLAADSGEVLWCGRPARGIAFRRVLGYMPQQQGLYESYTGRRFLAYMAALKEIPRAAVPGEVARVAAAVNLTDELDKRLAAYSGGMKQRLLLASALLGDPKLLILDEPTAGQDFRHYTDIMEFLRGLNAKGVTVVMITHDMHLMLEYTPRALAFCDGRLIAEYLQELKDAGVDTLILGCTHYPLLKKMIGDFMGDEVHLVDSGKVTAQAAAAALDDLGLLNGKKTGGTARYFVSDTPDNFDELAHTFLGEYAGGTVERIAIETY